MANKRPLPTSLTVNVPRNHDEIRKQLLRKLGIYQNHCLTHAAAGDTKDQNCKSLIKTCLLDRSNVCEEPLQFSNSEDKAMKRPQIFSSSEKKSRGVVSFQESVFVVLIPSHRDYSQDTRERMWTSSEQMIENAKRNAVEFISDGSDWRKAAEEDSMWKNSQTGELLHPVHIPEEVVQYYQQKIQTEPHEPRSETETPQKQESCDQ